MNMKRILALLLAMLLCMSAFAFAETAEQAEPAAEEAVAEEAAAEETAAEETAAEETTATSGQPTDNLIAKFGDVELYTSDAIARFLSYYNMLANYGFDMQSYVPYIKEVALNETVQLAIQEHMVHELGYMTFSDEELAEIEADAKSTYDSTYAKYYESFQYNADTDPASETTAYLEANGYTPETVLERAKVSFATDKMVAELTKDAVLTEEALQEYYDAQVAADEKEYFLQFAAYENARTNNTDDVIAWNPEGYRRVLQVLIGFDDDTKAQYGYMQEQLDNLLNADPAAEATAEPEETADGEEAYALTADDIKHDMELLTRPLMETAEEVTEKFNNGASIEDLMAEYSADENIPAEGYYVNANSEMWDPAFVDAAFSVTEKGQLSAPYAGQHGLYMVYYLDDVPAGPVPLDELREVLEPMCADQLQTDAYYAILDGWYADLGVETFMDDFITGYEG